MYVLFFFVFIQIDKVQTVFAHTYIGLKNKKIDLHCRSSFVKFYKHILTLQVNFPIKQKKNIIFMN